VLPFFGEGGAHISLLLSGLTKFFISNINTRWKKNIILGKDKVHRKESLIVYSTYAS